MTGLIHAFSNAVPMKRGGSHSSACSTRVDTDACRSRSRSARSRSAWPRGACAPRRVTSCAVCAIGASATMRMPAAAHALRKFVTYVSPDQRLLDEHADLGVPALRRAGAPRRSARRSSNPCGSANVHSPSQSSVPRDADRRHLEALLDRLAGRDAVVGDGGPEDRETALVDQLAVRVDDRLDRSLRAGPRPRGTRSRPAGRSVPCSRPC